MKILSISSKFEVDVLNLHNFYALFSYPWKFSVKKILKSFQNESGQLCLIVKIQNFIEKAAFPKRKNLMKESAVMANRSYSGLEEEKISAAGWTKKPTEKSGAMSLYSDASAMPWCYFLWYNKELPDFDA